jgi:hypothetical protein
MPMFMTRVELHNATWQDYENLHQKMEASGFSRKIQGSDGTWYKLPTAEYDITTSSTLEQIRSLAKACADATGKGNSILTCEYARAGWNNLDRA